jgi:hypothetical protein
VEAHSGWQGKGRRERRSRQIRSFWAKRRIPRRVLLERSFVLLRMTSFGSVLSPFPLSLSPFSVVHSSSPPSS